ncbi:MAG: hypothetical protein ISR58_10685 [Anaerolineales bacterium]|nr:hypothetical protein [Chloroflexota bacterium]MBL6981641.1 hypothetical protein [Anaerolineales bacterium]
MTSTTPKPTPIPMRRVLKTWLPLAGSWLLMGAELPALSAFVARLAEPEINLAAYGGIVFPLALIIESPIIMLLAASTALSKDWDSYRKIYAFMMITAGALTVLHIAVAFTPLYYFVIESIIGAPQEIVEPARIGLQIMTPWTWSIAYRRFNQGILIRFGRPNAVTIGTLIRLGTDLTVLGIGLMIGTIPGIVVATAAVAASVVSEAVYIGIVTRPVIRNQLRQAPAVEPSLTFSAFMKFYVPLALTSLLTLMIQPIGSAAISRMPRALESLAVWPVVIGLSFLFRSTGVAYNEVVVSLMDEPGSSPTLRKFAGYLVGLVTLFQLAIVATPLAEIWFHRVSGLSLNLTILAINGMWLALLLPGINALQSWFQGTILFSRRTRGIPEAVVIFLITISGILWAGVTWNKVSGLYVGLIAFTAGMSFQAAWLWVRSRPAMAQANARDT